MINSADTITNNPRYVFTNRTEWQNIFVSWVEWQFATHEKEKGILSWRYVILESPVTICESVVASKDKTWRLTLWFHEVLVGILLTNMLYLPAELRVTKQKFPLLGIGARKALFTSRITQNAVHFGIDCFTHAFKESACDWTMLCTFQVTDIFMEDDKGRRSSNFIQESRGDDGGRCKCLQIGRGITIGFKTGAVQSRKQLFQLCGGERGEVGLSWGKNRKWDT